MPLDSTAGFPLPFASTLAGVAPPPILECRGWAAAYDGRHGSRIDLTQAVPGWPPPAALRERLAAAAADPAHAGYGPLEGEPALREAVAAETNRLYGGDVDAGDVGITAGATAGFNLAMTVLAGSADQVLLPTPWFFNHQMALALRGVGVVPLPCRADDGFLPDPERAAAAITPATRAVVLVSPNNPTGAILPSRLLEHFAELCRRHRLWLILDETYRDFLPAAAATPHELFARDDWRDFVVQLYSFSKAYCVPGHRMGAVIGGPSFRASLLKAVDNLQICPPRPPQPALAWAIANLLEWRESNRQRIAERAAAFAGAMAGAPGWQVDAIGAYFAWIRVPAAARDSMQVARRLAERRGIVTLPGPVFGPGAERHLRMAFANLPDTAYADLPGRLAGVEAA